MASSSLSTLVIKVNYGDIMRRFSAQILNGKLGLTLNELRKKILSLFGFPLDKSIMVHYIDEDGDMVTLVDYADLCDVIKQGLNPLRLTFSLIYEGNEFDDRLLPDRLYSKLRLSDDPLPQPQKTTNARMPKNNSYKIPSSDTNYNSYPYKLLDSSFVEDVNVVDGSVLLPLTACTKIWRMRNTGTIVWPKVTRLVWVGGYKLSNQPVELEIPAAGLPVGRELDVAVNFVSPSNPGDYKSYWRMSLPSGIEFGPQIWVHFKVNKSIHDLLGGYSASSSVFSGATIPELDWSLRNTQKRAEEQLISKLEEMGYKDFNLNREILMKHNYGWDQTLEELSRVAKWDPMLEELDKMGFHNAELNKKLLKKNNGSIKRVVCDLLTEKDAVPEPTNAWLYE